MAENIVKQHGRTLPIVIIRLPNVLGVREDKILNVLKLVNKRIFPLLGNGDKETSLCFVEDAVQALILASEKDKARGETYFVTDGRAYSWREIVRSIARELGVGPFVLKLPYWSLLGVAGVLEAVAKLNHKPPLTTRCEIRVSRKYYWLFDSRKIEEELGYKAQVEFEKGIKDIVRWYREKGMV